MSRYAWEKGEIVIPSAEWADFKAAIRKAYNRHQKKLYSAARDICEQARKDGKDKRNYDYRERVRELAEQDNRLRTYDAVHSVMRSMFFRDGERRPATDKPLKPRKKDFPQKTNRDNKLRVNSDTTIGFDNDDRVFIWHVHENNHAVENAREHPVAKAAFRALNRVDWTRNSGGVFWGNDEYNRDAARHNPGGGGSYITSAYGPKGKERQEFEQGLSTGGRTR